MIGYQRLVVGLLTLLMTVSYVRCDDLDYWNTAIQGPIHDISALNDSLETTAGRLQTMYYPGTFTPPSAPATTLRISLRPGAYKLLALAFPQPLPSRATPCQYTTLTLDYGESQQVMCMSNQTTDTSPLEYKSLNVSQVSSVLFTISFPAGGQVQAYTGYRIFYQFFTKDNAGHHMFVPIYLASSSSFPAKVSQSAVGVTYPFDLVLYESISLQLLGLDEEAGGCDETYIQVGSQKLCKDSHNFTVTIDDKMYHSNAYQDYTVTYRNTKSYTGFGMLVKIEGTTREKWLGICVSSQLIIPHSSGKGTILSPGWPFDYPSTAKNCRISVDADLISYSYTTSDATTSPDCAAGRLTIGSNTTLCSGAGNVTRRYVKPDSHSISFRFDKPTQANSKPFRIDYETLSFTNICSDNGKTITTLPYMVKSPNFPMNYPSEKSCYVNVNAPGAVDITIEFLFMDLEERRGCHNDYLDIRSQKYCGKNMTGKSINITAPGGFFVIFRSDVETQKSGFAIRISSPQITTTATTTTTTTTTIKPTTTEKSVSKPTGKTSGKDSSDKMPKAGKQGSSQSHSGTSIGLGIGIPLLLILIVVVVVFVLKRKRNYHVLLRNADMDVSFENPSFGQRQSILSAGE